ncbi:MAG: hypothetical protein A2338_03475 [Bacteroidetes bacterium RIFOXYB12_FULL_41_6]|nr:MAG: hypothetical protein A2338_03475 [Bacteroidetes bacterium RIFOXYB12_FULL_41_6]
MKGEIHEWLAGKATVLHLMSVKWDTIHFISDGVLRSHTIQRDSMGRTFQGHLFFEPPCKNEGIIP